MLQGYVKRQAVFACNTCTPSAAEHAGICLACANKCHDGHDIFELYTKRFVVKVLLCVLAVIGFSQVYNLCISFCYLQKFPLWLWKQEVWGIQVPAHSCESPGFNTTLSQHVYLCPERWEDSICSICRPKMKKTSGINTTTTSTAAIAHVTDRIQTQMIRYSFWV